MKLYEETKIKGIDCYYIGTKEGKDMFLCKYVLDEEQIKKYTNNDEIMISGNQVRFDDNLRSKTWEETYLKKVLCKNMGDDLGCEVDILSKDEVEKLPNEIKYINNFYWTSSRPSSTYAWCVLSTFVSDYYLTYTYAVRPVLYLPSKSNKIEKINHCYVNSSDEQINFLMDNLNELSEKINEIIDILNEMEEENV